MLGKEAIAVWIAVVAAVGAGSLAIAIQPVSDEKIHLQDVDGKINTNVPVAASRAFSPLPVEFDADSEPAPDGTIVVGSSIATKQKVVINFADDVSETALISFVINNRSEDTQIFLIKASAPSQVIIDAESGSMPGGATIHGLVGHNEWLASAGTGNKVFGLEVHMTDAGMYPIVVELLRVG